MNYDQMIEVIQAQKDGKKIEIRVRKRTINDNPSKEWKHSGPITIFNFNAYEYRVKKEPRVMYARMRDESDHPLSFTRDRSVVEGYVNKYGGELVKFVEVTDEEN